MTSLEPDVVGRRAAKTASAEAVVDPRLAEPTVNEVDARSSERADDLLRLACAVSGMPSACFGLDESDEVWPVETIGFGADAVAAVHRAFAPMVVARAELVRVLDPSPTLVPGGLGPIRTLVGVPFVSAQGEVIGALTLLDTQPRDIDEATGLALEALARQCVRLIESRKSLRTKREAEQRLGLIFESAIDYAIMALDTDGAVVSWNAGAEHIFGWSEAEMLGRHVSRLFTVEDREGRIAALDLDRATEQGRAIDERYYVRKSGLHFWGTGETMPLLARSGATRGYLKILRDRTSQKRIKEALEYQTSVLQAITDHMAEALFQVDTDYRVTFLNPAAEEMFGWSRFELIGVNLHDRLHYVEPSGASVPREQSPYVIALKSRAALMRRPDVFVHHDGRFIDVLVSFKPVVADGVVTGGVLTLVDVTETKKIEAALQATQERYQLAVSASDIVGSWDWDLVRQTITADATFAGQYGVDPALAERGAPLATFQASIHPEDRAAVFAEIERSLSSRTPYVGEYRLLRPDGSIRWVSTYARGLYDTAGRPVRCPGLSVDISERKRNEERRAALLELEDRLRNLESTADISGQAAEIVCRLLEVKRAGFGLIDSSGDYVVIERDFATDGSPSIAGIYNLATYGSYGERLKSGVLAIEDVLHDPLSAEHGERWKAFDLRGLVTVPLKADGRLAAMFFAHSAVPRAWTQDDIALIANIADRTWSAIARAQAAAQEEMLTGELRHRIKNTITMIQAIAQQTMRRAATKEDGYAAFEARLIALSDAQNILTQSSWSAASLADVVEGSLKPHRPADLGRIGVEGPEINLSAKTALSFALSLHELATNATKYGALSNDTGTIAIMWERVERAGAPVFHFRWKENGGPPVAPPNRKGYGTRLIKGGFSRDFAITIGYEPDGLSCDVEGPWLAL